MEPRIKKFIDSLYRFPQSQTFDDTDLDRYLQPWGFTIYRTYYGPGSDQQWEKLLQNITSGVKHQLKRHESPIDDPATICKAEELFKLDARSDSTLDGLTLEEVRQLYHDGTGGQPMNTDKDPWRIFILADEEVLAIPSLIKCVAADYDAAACVPKNPRFGPQRYFGWLRMSPNHVLKLWFELEIYFLKQIVNYTAGGPGAWWDPDEC
ncbi:hypothetical protein GGP41_003572 [Bipolaris sorokiniana]|uniref:Uncharacterized protein n=2 Tax=Cochliobolus sativus TaxID=45130 RepID=A0A8H5ZCK4_COCSA|nr:uncharacterized protein COCSADRAFT_356143 [Bipolaris sorokiniana ND90Pr]EMD64906.1 hypothetical protein COCSADRAFT_356143 [Bipolaris sorokiniana ND90Pr]KAF5846189.1 hypothetical protein GGP41_003572 [Bipolaris sorokiniana]